MSLIAHLPLIDDLSFPVGVGSPTFTRSTTGTYVDKDDGLVKIAAIDVARFEARGLLIEGTSENLYLRSEDFSHANWNVKTNLSVTANDATAPDGAVTMDLIEPDSGTNANSLAQDVSVTSGDSYTKSVYVSAAGYDFLQITGGAGFNASRANFNLSTGTIGATDFTSSSASILDLGGGIYRCTFTTVASSTEASGQIIVSVLNADTDSRLPSFTASGSDGVNLWGAQMTEDVAPRSYIPTTSSTVTRAADNLTIQAAGNLPDQSADQSFEMFVDMEEAGPVNPFVMTVGGQGNRRIFSASSASITFDHKGTIVISSIGFNTVAKVTATKEAAVLRLYKDNSFVTSGASGTVTGTATSIAIGSDQGSSTRYLNGHIKAFKIYDTAIIPSTPPSPTFLSAWAKNSNTLLQGGM